MRRFIPLPRMLGFLLLLTAGSRAQSPADAAERGVGPARLTLREALELALEENPVLRSVDAQRAAAASRVWEARSGHLPQISLNAGYTWYQEPNIVFPIHRAGVFPPLDDRIFESSVQATLPLFAGGKVVRRTDAAKAGARQADARGAVARQDLLQQIGLLYVGAAELTDRRALLGARLADLRTRHAELQAQLGEGRASQAHLALLDAQMASVRADSMQAAQTAGELAWRLGQLTGSDGAIEPVIGEETRPAVEVLPNVAEADAMPVERNSEWQLAHAQKMQAEAEASFASRAFYPEIAGFAVYNYRSSGREWDPAGEWAAGVRLSLPLLDGGRSIAALSTTKASLRAAEENLQAVAQRAHAEREVAIAALARLRSIKEAARRKETFVEAQRDLYASGRLSLSELETQETELLQLALQAKSLNYEALRASIQVSRAAGTLDKEMLLMITVEEAR